MICKTVTCLYMKCSGFPVFNAEADLAVSVSLYIAVLLANLQ